MPTVDTRALVKVVARHAGRVDDRLPDIALSSKLSTSNWTFTEGLRASFASQAIVDADGEYAITLRELAAQSAESMALAGEQIAAFHTSKQHGGRHSRAFVSAFVRAHRGRSPRHQAAHQASVPSSRSSHWHYAPRARRNMLAMKRDNALQVVKYGRLALLLIVGGRIERQRIEQVTKLDHPQSPHCASS